MLYETTQLGWLTSVSPEIVFFLFKVGEAMLEPTIRLYIYESSCIEQLGDNSSSCSHLSRFASYETTVQVDAARNLLLYRILLNAPAIALILFYGDWSDKVGRKLPVMVACLGTIVALMFYILSEAAGVRYVLPYILIGAAVRGVTGKSAVVNMALYSYVADVSQTDERTHRLGRLLAMNFFGYFVGLIGAATLLSVAGINEVFSVVVVVYLLCVLVTMTCIRESDEPRVDKDGSTFLPGNGRASLAVLTRMRNDGKRTLLVVLFAAVMLNQACKSGEVDVTMLLVRRRPLDWSQPMYVYLLATDYACLGLAVLVLLPIIIRIAHPHDITLVLTGICFKIIRLGLLAFGDGPLTVYASVIVGCPSAIIISGLKSLVSKTVDKDEMGKMFSLLSCGETLGSLLGGVALTAVYAGTVQLMPGFAFILDIVLYVGLFSVLLIVGNDMRKQWRHGLVTDMERKSTENRVITAS